MRERETITVLIVEDEPDLREILRYNLEREGYKVLESEDGEAGLALLRAHLPNIVLLDIMLPGMDGVEICRSIKYDPQTRAIPVIMVTARGDESDIVLGLGVGADDYIIKPFSPRELIARIKAVLRRAKTRHESNADERIVRERLVIDPPRHELMVDGKKVDLTPTEFRLVSVLAARPGRVFTRDQLISRVLGDDVVVTERNVDVHIRSIRKKLGAARELVETIRGIGYRFREDTAEE